MRSWPASVHTWMLQEGFRILDDDDRASFKPDSGPPMFWPLSTLDTTVYEGSTLLTVEQQEDLAAFYKNDLAKGSVMFERADPVTGVVSRFKFETPITYAPVVIDYHDREYRWRASFGLRRMP